MYGLKKIHLHTEAVKQLPSSGQRRDMLLKTLRKIQVIPESADDFQWSGNTDLEDVRVTLCVGYAISWTEKEDTILVLDIHAQ